MTVVRDSDDRAGVAGAPVATRRRLRWLLPSLGIVAFLVAGGPLAGLAGKLSGEQKNDSAAYLPASAEATRALKEQNRFAGGETLPAIVVYARASGLTGDDRRKIAADASAMATWFGAKLAAPPSPPVVSDDGRAAEVLLLFRSSDPQRLRGDIDWARQRAASGGSGLDSHVTGPAGIFADLLEVFGQIDGVLLAVTGVVVLLILIVVYRSPILPFLVLAVAGVALGLANGTAYLLARHGVLTVSGQSQGILDVLVLGAGTDYALLLVSRFREELRRHDSRYDAMRVAWRASVQPIVASAGTVILGLLCLLVSDLAATRGLGPVGAIGIGCALVSMLVLLPAVIVLLGRAAFWPFRPGYGSPPAEERGIWSRVARGVGRRPRLVWVSTALVLGALGFGVVRLQADGVPQTEAFLTVQDKARKTAEWTYLLGKGCQGEVYAKQGKQDLVFLVSQSVLKPLRGELLDPTVFHFEPSKV